MDHKWTNQGGTGWHCDAIKKYGVKGIPTCLLIDPKGKIVLRDYPWNIKVEEEIDKLLGKSAKTAEKL